jgi:uncharacterized protein
MSLEEKVAEVERVLESLDREIASFQSWSHLHCQWGCGKCCYKADIEASALEFLPFALHLYQEGKAFEWLEKIEQTDSSICLILNPTQGGAGLCSEYKHRGLICRLFGYSARTNKYGKKELVTCQIIKTEQVDNYTKAAIAVEQGEAIPVMNQFYMQLHAIDFNLAQEFFPINKAIKRAIEIVLHYYAYRS